MNLIPYGLNETITSEIKIKREMEGQVMTDLTKYPSILQEIECLNEKIRSKQARNYQDLVTLLLDDLNTKVEYIPKNLKMRVYDKLEDGGMLDYTNQVLANGKGGARDIDLTTWHLLDLILPDTDTYEFIYKKNKKVTSLLIYSSTINSYIAVKMRNNTKNNSLILKKENAPKLYPDEVNDKDEDDELDDLQEDILQIGSLASIEVRNYIKTDINDSVRDKIDDNNTVLRRNESVRQ